MNAYISLAYQRLNTKLFMIVIREHQGTLMGTFVALSGSFNGSYASYITRVDENREMNVAISNSVLLGFCLVD